MAALASDWLRHFRLLLWNCWTEFKETWQEARSQRPLPSLCFSGRSENKMAALVSDWLRHFQLLLWNRWTEFNETWQEARSQRPLPSLCFSGRSEKQDGRPCLWLAETFSTSSLNLLNGIQGNLTGSKISTSSTKFVFFGAIGKTRWPPWPLIGWDIFDFSSETAERNSTKLDRKQDLNVLYQVCVFRADRKTRWLPWPLIGLDIFDFSSETAERNSTKLDRKQDLNVLYQVCVFQADRKNKMATLASDWLRHFRLLLWNRWTEFNKTWQEARSQTPLPSLCFLGGSEKQDGRCGQSAKKVAHYTQVHDMWPFGPLVCHKVTEPQTDRQTDRTKSRCPGIPFWGHKNVLYIQNIVDENKIGISFPILNWDIKFYLINQISIYIFWNSHHNW